MIGGPVGGLVGRSAELALVRGLLRDAAGGRGRCLLVEGEPGIGKSVLLTEALAGAEAFGCEVLRGQCDELGGRFPLSVMTRLLGVDERSPDPRRAETARALKGEEAADGWTMRLLSGDPVAAAVEQMLALVDRLCARGPVVLVVEDLHWADEASLVMWRRLCQASVQLPLLVVWTCRPVARRAGLEQLRGEVRAREGVVVSLGPLAEEAVSELAGLVTGCVPGPRLAQRLASAAGNPLYVRELLAAAARVGALQSAERVVELVSGDRVARALGSLSGVIADRLDVLSAGAREVLRTAALLGPEFSLGDLGTVAAQGPEEMAGRVAEALDAGVLEESGARLRFRHGLLKEVLYEATPMALRAALHQHAAQALIASGAPAERVAELILPALEVTDGWELDWLADNARQLVDRAPEIAAELLEHTLGHTDTTDPRHAGLGSQLASACHWLGRDERAEQLARGMLRTDDPERIGQAHWLLGRIAIRLGRQEELTRLAEAEPDPRVGDIWHARLLALRAEVLCFLGRDADAALYAAQALTQGERHADPVTMAYALNCRSRLDLHRHDLTGALANIDRALAVIGTNAQLLELRLTLLGNRGAALDYLCRYQEASESIGLARSLAERVAVPRLPRLLVQSAEMYFEHGNWDDALLELEQAAGGLKEHYLFMQHGMMALITGRQNNWQQAERHLAALDGQEYPPGWISASNYWVLARALAAQRAGRPGESVEVLAAFLTSEYADGVAARSDQMPGLVRAALAADDRQTAHAAAQACRQDAGGDLLPRIRAYADWCEGLVSADPAPVLAAADYIRELDRRPDLGNALEDAAVLQANAGDVEGARTTLDQALAVYAELGAEWDSRRARARLRSSGVLLGVRGPRQRPKTGWDALTATELRVAEQVAAGQSNPDIAEHLLLSRRTVETHVSHILTKLPAHSRREVAELARARG
ncbi:ATP-binding protein [Streptomyces sp. NPDC048527]|uniref:ATP-binding protein n=1 Tax=Streptomyces sp. NPDC048527 TaxID=3365568 RepID=UPI003713B9C1